MFTVYNIPLYIPKAEPEPSHLSKIETFASIVNNFQPLAIVEKHIKPYYMFVVVQLTVNFLLSKHHSRSKSKHFLLE